MSSITDTAKAIYDAYVAKNRAAAERLVADDFHFTSPLDNRLNRESYFTICWPNRANTEGFEIVHMVNTASTCSPLTRARASNHAFTTRKSSRCETDRSGR